MSLNRRREEVASGDSSESQKRDPAQDPMPCTFCNAMTTRGTLSAYGARCFRCYQAYCSAHIPRPAWMEGKK